MIALDDRPISKTWEPMELLVDRGLCRHMFWFFHTRRLCDNYLFKKNMWKILQTRQIRHLGCTILLFFLLGGCNTYQSRTIETTAYCGCGTCCSWERGSWKYLKLDFWNKYIDAGKGKGQPYSGRTASGTKPREPVPGLFSIDSLKHPWMIPFRVLFPWLWFHRDGTIAADTTHYPFGTRMYVPGYGWGVVTDRGSAIKGPDRIDLFFSSHDEALVWGRKKVEVLIVR